ncbi:MAG: MBL fold metallo-hydrolase [Rhodobacteraceae bacterium]|nr:MBL fold metallo-hydrolase [Paracoccaceae bacterium]
MNLEPNVREAFRERPSDCHPVEVEPGILWFQMPLPMALDHVNVYALRDEDGWTIIDTGFDTGRTRAIWGRIEQGVLAGSPIARIVLTHHHPDHVGLAGFFKSRFGARILSTRVAWLTARMLVLDMQEKPVEEALAFYRMAGMEPRMYERKRHERPFNFSDCVHSIPPGFERLNEGDCIRMGGHDWMVRIGHGHAPAHATFWRRDGRMVIGGDQFLADITSNIGVHPTEPKANPLKEWFASCYRFQTIADNDLLVLPGHKMPFVGLKSRLGELIGHHRRVVALLEHELATPKLATDVFGVLFGRDIPEGEYGFALSESIAHLNFLHDLGRVRKIAGPNDATLWVSTVSARERGADLSKGV